MNMKHLVHYELIGFAVFKYQQLEILKGMEGQWLFFKMLKVVNFGNFLRKVRKRLVYFPILEREIYWPDLLISSANYFFFLKQKIVFSRSHEIFPKQIDMQKSKNLCFCLVLNKNREEWAILCMLDHVCNRVFV